MTTIDWKGTLLVIWVAGVALTYLLAVPVVLSEMARASTSRELVRAFSDHSSGFSAYWLFLPLCWPIILLADAIIRLQKNGFTDSLYMHLLGGEIEKRRPVPEAVLAEAPDYRSLPVEKPVTTEDSSDALQMLVR